MRNTSIAFFARPALTVLAVVISLHAHTADNTSINAHDPSLLDQLLSPPAPLRDSSSANFIGEISDQARHWFTASGSDAGSGKHWQLALDKFANADTPTAQLNGLQRFSSAFFDQALSQQTASTGQTAERFALMQSINSAAASLMTLPNKQRDGAMVLNANALPASDNSRQIGQWLANAAQYAGNLQISAVLPRDANFASQAPAETAMTAINSPEVTRYLEQHSESVSLLAQLLGWQKTGLLPSATDLQKMAASHVGAVTSSIERWALQNVSISASSLAITNSDTQEQNLQWQWSATNTTQYNSNSVAENEANFGVNLRRLFGMSDYY